MGLLAPAKSAGMTMTAVREQAVLESKYKAAVWAIRPSDWVRYRELMAGPRGAWSPDADPLSVLGVSAESATERRRFADAFVHMEFQRVQGELAFQREVTLAWKRNFPGRLRLQNLVKGKSGASKSSARIGLAEFASIQRYALVLEPECDGCSQVLNDYIALVKGSTNKDFAVDIYLRKTGQDNALLRAWVAKNGVPIALIRNRKMTVNHGDKYGQGTVPQVWALLGNGQWVLR